MVVSQFIYLYYRFQLFEVSVIECVMGSRSIFMIVVFMF